MAAGTMESLAALYEQDETAWLDAMAELAREGRSVELDLANLAEYLSDMAKWDRREVESRLVVLLAHLLKWTYQPDRRSRSWRVTVVKQRQELVGLAYRGVLRNHAETALAEAYAKAVERAAAETGIAPGAFPTVCPYTLEELLTVTLPKDEN